MRIVIRNERKTSGNIKDTEIILFKAYPTSKQTSTKNDDQGK